MNYEDVDLRYEVFPAHSIRHLTINARHHVNFVLWLGGLRVLNVMNRRCSMCDHDMRLERSSRKPDYCRLRCTNSRCRRSVGIREGSFFENKDASLLKILIVMHCFHRAISIENTAVESGLHRNTVGRYYAELHQLVAQDLENHPVHFDTVGRYQTDECLYSNLQTDVPGVLADVTVAGIYCEDSQTVVFYFVEDRSIESLIPPIREKVPRHSFVFTDKWAAYKRLKRGYRHYYVNHNRHQFSKRVWVRGVGVVRVTTNNMEGYWRRLRRRVRQTVVRSVRYLQYHMNLLTYRSLGRSIYRLIRM